MAAMRQLAEGMRRLLEFTRTVSPFAGLILAFTLGLLIGVERSWSHRLMPNGARVAGIRTFALLGLAGGIAGELGVSLSPYIGGALLLIAGAPLFIGYARAAAKGDLSGTTAVVGAVTLGLGALAATRHFAMASIAAAVTTVVLAQRRILHGWVGRLSASELQAIARFGLIALAILPVLPDRDQGPLAAWNPRQIWMIVVFVSGFSLLAYGVGKQLGGVRGAVAVAAAVGAMVSSTATTAVLARRIRSDPIGHPILFAGIAVASAVMFTRVTS